MGVFKLFLFLKFPILVEMFIKILFLKREFVEIQHNALGF